jgi:hypothetical protein
LNKFHFSQNKKRTVFTCSTIFEVVGLAPVDVVALPEAAAVIGSEQRWNRFDE